LVKRDRGRRKTKAEKRARSGRKPPTSFAVHYASPRDLQLVGPLVWVAWSVPESLARRLLEAGRAVPAPVSGRLLVDTGASATAISVEAAQELGLQPVDVGHTYGAHGLQQNPIYEAHLSMSIAGPGGESGVEADLRVSGIREMEAMFQKLGVRTGGQDGGRLVGLLGRDFLRHAVLTYDGTYGVVTLKIVPGSFVPRPAPRD
jgi:hypothetical protein